MFRFFRRIFVLLLFFTIIFLVYRYIDPVGASMFVDKIKTISDDILDFVGFNKQKEINITGTTLTITGDLDALMKKEDLSINNGTGDEDLDWLEDLSMEIEKILGKNDNGSGDLLKEDADDQSLSGNTVGLGEKDGANNEKTEESMGLYTGSNIDSVDSTQLGLTDSDYKQMKNVFNNLIE